MRYIAAYLLLQIGGNASPSKQDIKKLLSTVGVDTDEERLDKLISELDGKSIDQVRTVLVVPWRNMLTLALAHLRRLFQALLCPIRWRWWWGSCRWRSRCRCRPCRRGKGGEEGGSQGKCPKLLVSPPQY